MYLEHFGLQEFPFTLTPNTAFFFDQGAYREALNVLLVTIRSGEGFIKITGEVGTGKTLLCRLLLNALDDGEFATAYIPNPGMNAHGLRRALADELGLDLPRNCGQHDLLKALNERLLTLYANGRRVVVVIDEAQTMPDDALEAVRLLGNLETERSKLLQVVLFGQPELDARLSESGLRQLRQRIGFGYQLRALPPDALSHYLQFRLQAAGWRGGALFAAPAIKRLYRGSGGVPRRVNILAHKALLAAFGEGRYQVLDHHVKRAVADTDDVSDSAGLTGRLAWPAVLAGTGSAALVACWRLLG